MENNYISGGGRGLCKKGWHTNHYTQLNVCDYMADVPNNTELTDLVEVQFKNTRKGYFHNSNNLELQKGDVVAVEGNPGHDIGTVTLTGTLAALQAKKANLRSEDEIKRVYRLAKEGDMEKYEQAKALEHQTMIESRKIAKDLGLEMKIGDVEYQGDGNKAIFYYIADGRVDFRQLIKVLAEAFHVRIEMKQIGARQEAGRIGGFGPCGRELCCSTWMKTFTSVGTAAARFQNLSLNPQKLAGQCAKLKCCMNYEVDQYMEAGRKMPHREDILYTQGGEWYFFKSDILGGTVSYSSDKHLAANITTITAERALEIIAQNKRGENPPSLSGEERHSRPHTIDLATQEDLSRFDAQLASKKKKKKKKKRNDEERSANAANNATTNGATNAATNAVTNATTNASTRENSGATGQAKENAE